MSSGGQRWINALELGVLGRGWSDSLARAYDRLPSHAQTKVTEAVWNLSRQSAGMHVDFRCDAGSLHARCKLRRPPSEGQAFIRYLDLYGRDHEGKWRWAGVSRFGVHPSGETPIIDGLERGMRDWRLYLPLTYEIDSLELGIPEDAEISPAPVDPRRPIVLYGTSIVHGCAHPSRPGMVWPSILARRLDWPLINLGFSGSARMEPPLAEVLAELDPILFGVDPLANMSRELVEENALPFLKILCQTRPSTPLLLIEDRTATDAWLRPGYLSTQSDKQAAFRSVAVAMEVAGADITYIHGAGLLGDDSEGTTDGSHPNDLGAMRYADVVTPVLQTTLKRITTTE